MRKSFCAFYSPVFLVYLFTEAAFYFFYIFKSNFLTTYSPFIWFLYIILIKPRRFYISIDCSSLNVFWSSFSHLSQMLGRSNVLSQIYILDFFKHFIPFTLSKIVFFHAKLFKIYLWKTFLVIGNIFSSIFSFVHICLEKMN